MIVRPPHVPCPLCGDEIYWSDVIGCYICEKHGGFGEPAINSHAAATAPKPAPGSVTLVIREPEPASCVNLDTELSCYGLCRIGEGKPCIWQKLIVIEGVPKLVVCNRANTNTTEHDEQIRQQALAGVKAAITEIKRLRLAAITESETMKDAEIRGMAAAYTNTLRVLGGLNISEVCQ